MMELKIKNVLEELNLSKSDITTYTNCFTSIWNLVKSKYLNVDEAHNENHIFHVFQRSMKMVFWLKRNSDEWNEKKERDYILCMGLASFMHDVYSYSNRKFHHEKAYLLLRKITDLKIAETSDINVIDKARNVVDLQNEILYFLYSENIKNENLFDWLKYYNKTNLLNVSEMVLQHRASYNKDFSSELCEMFSAADRDDLNLEVVIKRILKCAEDDNCVFECDKNNFKPLAITINHTSYHSEEIIPYLKNTLEWNDKMIKTFYHLWEKFSRVGYMYSNLNSDGFYMRYYKNQLEEFWEEIDEIISSPEKMVVWVLW